MKPKVRKLSKKILLAASVDTNATEETNVKPNTTKTEKPKSTKTEKPNTAKTEKPKSTKKIVIESDDDDDDA